MGTHLDKLRKLDRITGKMQQQIKKLFVIAKEGLKHPDKDLATFCAAFAWLNYQFSIYLIKKFPEAVESDKIDKQFGIIMEDFKKGKNIKKLKKQKNWLKNFLNK